MKGTVIVIVEEEDMRELVQVAIRRAYTAPGPSPVVAEVRWDQEHGVDGAFVITLEPAQRTTSKRIQE